MIGNKFRDLKLAERLIIFDLGLQWNALTEAGGVVVSNKVKIEILAEFNKVKEALKQLKL